ncbi:hypothetical protein [Burkholderia gladioli]|uniref:hypothetical protein n=1 Tax=Burkholderia gladioli TaxID=28095 RepID=UPI000A5974EF|nr:hypothetical protein [Burkholderia gladioli]
MAPIGRRIQAQGERAGPRGQRRAQIRLEIRRRAAPRKLDQLEIAQALQADAREAPGVVVLDLGEE